MPRDRTAHQAQLHPVLDTESAERLLDEALKALAANAAADYLISFAITNIEVARESLQIQRRFAHHFKMDDV